MKLRELPLVALRTFAVVSDAGTVMAAADALGVTHSAVSKQIKQLERWLGQRLFLQEGRRLVLTPFGQMLSSKVIAALEDIAANCDYVLRHRERRTITVEAPATFAMHWLLPRLHEFRASEPQTDVWVSTRMTGQSPNFSGHDLVVVRGEPAATSARLNKRVALFREEMTVLSSPKLLRLKPLVQPEDIKRHDLIESMTRPQDWQTWLKRAGVEGAVVAGGHRFDHLFVAMQAVSDGLGSIVAPRNLFPLSIARKELACPFAKLNFSGERYYGHHADRPADPTIKKFVDWLVQTSPRKYSNSDINGGAGKVRDKLLSNTDG